MFMRSIYLFVLIELLILPAIGQDQTEYVDSLIQILNDSDWGPDWSARIDAANTLG